MLRIEKPIPLPANNPKSRIARKYLETSGRHCHIQSDEPAGPATRSAESVLTV